MKLQTCNSILLYGGTFDPPHVAHLVLPQLAREAVGADVVAYIPAARAPHKPGVKPTAARHRLAMLRLALRGVKHAAILTDELDRAAAGAAGPSYTVDTLEALRARLGPGPVLRLLIGGDNLRIFHTWKNPARIIELAEPVVMVRPPDTKQSLLRSLPRGYSRKEWATRLVDLPLFDVSATQIRRRVAEGKSITGMVMPAVERYIAKNGVYC